MIWDGEIDFGQIRQAAEEPLGLTKRKIEDHADRQRGLFDQWITFSTSERIFFTRENVAPESLLLYR